MATFVYKATDISGRSTSGVVSADTGRQARDMLRGQGLTVRRLRERQAQAATTRSFPGIRRQHKAKLTVAIRELATLLQAGIPLLTALETLAEETSGSFQHCLAALRDRVASGSSLADAMQAETAVFDEMTIGMIRVGEHAGNLDEVCERVAEFRERSGEMADRVLSAVLYPAIVLVVSLVVAIFLMTAVVPMLLSNLIEMGRPLPWPTRILKSASDALLDYGLWILLSAGTMLLATLWAINTSKGRWIVAGLVQRLPVLGTLVQRQVLSRMALIVASLLHSGVELVDALAIAQRTSTNPLLKEALRVLRLDLESGRNLAASMKQHSIFTGSLRQVFHLGQQSGKLESMLLRIGNDYDRQAMAISSRFASVLEPILILNLAVMVGFILFATVLPILEAGNVLAE